MHANQKAKLLAQINRHFSILIDEALARPVDPKRWHPIAERREWLHQNLKCDPNCDEGVALSACIEAAYAALEPLP